MVGEKCFINALHWIKRLAIKFKPYFSWFAIMSRSSRTQDIWSLDSEPVLNIFRFRMYFNVYQCAHRPKLFIWFYSLNMRINVYFPKIMRSWSHLRSSRSSMIRAELFDLFSFSTVCFIEIFFGLLRSVRKQPSQKNKKIIFFCC